MVIIGYFHYWRFTRPDKVLIFKKKLKRIIPFNFSLDRWNSKFSEELFKTEDIRHIGCFRQVTCFIYCLILILIKDEKPIQCWYYIFKIHVWKAESWYQSFQIKSFEPQRHIEPNLALQAGISTLSRCSSHVFYRVSQKKWDWVFT